MNETQQIEFDEIFRKINSIKKGLSAAIDHRWQDRIGWTVLLRDVRVNGDIICDEWRLSRQDPIEPMKKALSFLEKSVST